MRPAASSSRRAVDLVDVGQRVVLEIGGVNGGADPGNAAGEGALHFERALDGFVARRARYDDISLWSAIRELHDVPALVSFEPSTPTRQIANQHPEQQGNWQ